MREEDSDSALRFKDKILLNSGKEFWEVVENERMASECLQTYSFETCFAGDWLDYLLMLGVNVEFFF